MEKSDTRDHGDRVSSPVDLSSHNDASSSSLALGSVVGDEISETNKLPEMSGRSGTSNFRDSLAWDVEFFTSSGVLDPEELSIITGGIENGKNVLLSATIKENSRSTDSLATLSSDNLSLESLEAELFEDIKASVKPFVKASKDANSRHKVGSVATNPKSSTAFSLANSRSSNNSDITSRKRLISRPASKTTAIGTQRSGKMMKQDSGSPQITQSVARIGDNARPPRGNSFSRPPLKAASLGANRVKNEIPHAITGSNSKEVRAAKLTCLVGSSLAVPKPVLSSKSSVGSPKRQPTRFSSTIDTSVNALCSNNSKSHSIPTRKNVDLRPVDQSKGGSSPKPFQNLTCMKKGPSNPQNSGGNENRVTGKPIQSIKKASTQSVIVSSPSSSVSQMPSPKVFIFNGAKSVIVTPMQSPSRSPSVLSKVGGGINSPNRLFKSRSSREKLVWHN